MRTKKHIAKWFQIGLGLFLILYALNKFFHFFPMSYGESPQAITDFLYVVAPYLPYLYVLELIIGLFLVLNKWPSFILIVLFPLSVAFLMFSVINNNVGELWPAVIVFVLNGVLLINNREDFLPLFD